MYAGAARMDKRRAQPDRFLGKGTPYLVFLVALLLTICATAYLEHSVRSKERERLRSEVQASTAHLTERMETYVELLRATRGLFAAANGRPKSAQFAAFVRSLELRRFYRGVQGIGFSARLRPDEVRGVVAGMHAAGSPHFQIRPAGDRAEYHTILYLEPRSPRNRAAIGFDMSTDPVRRAAMEQARDSGDPVLSGRVTLVQEIERPKQLGFLLYLPVYRKGLPTSSPAQRRAALLGFVYSPFRGGDLFKAVFGAVNGRGTAVEVYDGAEPSSDTLLHDSAADNRMRKPGSARVSDTETVSIAGHTWTLQFQTSPAFDHDTAANLVPVVFCGGLAISALLLALTLLQSQAREEAERVSDELRRSEQELREASRAKDEFLAMLGHELRNPLGAISNALQVMSTREITDPSLQRARAVVERQIRHQTRLIEDLLDVARVSSGKISLQREVVDLKTIARRAVEGLQWAVDEQQHQLSAELGDEPVLVEGDPVRLEQVIANLLHNAIKYTPGGGRVALSLHVREGQAVLSVQDSGVGISPEMLGRIFDVFTQAQISIDRSKGGLGLGLTLVRNLVCLHGGSVEAHSAGVGCGSEFLVKLPWLPAAELPASPDQRGVESSQSSAFSPHPLPTLPRRVLIVEDIKDARETLQELLELQGYHVVVASDGPEGLAKLLSAPPDVALIDIGLPGMSGYEVATRARTDARMARVRLIALTGYGQPEDRLRALSAGFDTHVVKPIDPVELERLLSE